MDRREKLFSGIDLPRTRGIEIGPLVSPLVTKTESTVYYVDHADSESLRAKYAGDPNVDPDKIVHVDAVWGERTLRECFPGASKFDYVVASHVIEHVPDMLGWMKEIAEVLRPGGRLCLAVPDKRFTFDYLRQPSRLNEIIDAYLRRNRRPMPAQIFDYNANAVELDMVAAWENRIDPAALKRYVNLRYALDRSIESVRDGTYVDGHCWVFTAASLPALLADLVELDLLPYRCARLYEPERNTNEIVLVLEHWAGDSAGDKAEARRSFLAEAQRLVGETDKHTSIEGAARERELRHARTRIEALEAALQSRTGELAAAQEKLNRLEGEIAPLFSSPFYRWSKRLRRVSGLAR